MHRYMYTCDSEDLIAPNIHPKPQTALVHDTHDTQIIHITFTKHLQILKKHR